MNLVFNVFHLGDIMFNYSLTVLLVYSQISNVKLIFYHKIVILFYFNRKESAQIKVFNY